MFRTDLLSITRSFETVYTAVGICHASYVDWKHVEFNKIDLRNSASRWLLLQEYIPKCLQPVCPFEGEV